MKKGMKLFCCALLLGWCFSVSAQVDDSGTSGAGVITHFHLSGALTEQPMDDPFGLLGGQVTSLKDLLERLDKARKDSGVKAVILTFNGMEIGTAQTEELRTALMKFRTAGKPLLIHVGGQAVEVNTRTFALLSAASSLSIEPLSDIWLTGLYGEALYLKTGMGKLGLGADFLQMGDYKSAAEMFTRTGPSEAAENNLNWLLDGLFETFVGMIAEARSLSPDKVRAIIDGGPYSARQALEAGLVDSVKYHDQFLADVRKEFGEKARIDNRYGEKKKPGIDLKSPFAFFTLLAQVTAPPKKPTRSAVGLVYVDGMILSGYAQPSPFGSSGLVFSGEIRNALEKAAADDTVKAVVMRVDSPGGSALGSEMILRALKQVRATKPVIVSMGNVAGSGGYYVSCAADTIFADEATITASIGVVGGKLVTSEMWDKLGVKWVAYKRGKRSNMLSSLSPFDEDQRKHLESWMEEIYGAFKQHVVHEREGKLRKSMEDIAGGRVFTGKQAKELGLVDEIGGLSDAIAYAAKKVNLDDYEVRIVPEPKNSIQRLLEEMSGTGKRSSDLSVRGGNAPPSAMTWGAMSRTTPGSVQTLLPILDMLDPVHVGAVRRSLRSMELLRTEGVLTVMPAEIIVR